MFSSVAAPVAEELPPAPAQPQPKKSGKGRSRSPQLASILGHRVRVIRTGKGLSQRLLAKAFKGPRTYISKIERGEICLNIKQIERMAEALGVTASQLLDDGISPLILAGATLDQGGPMPEIAKEIVSWLPRTTESSRSLMLLMVEDFTKRKQMSFHDYVPV